MKAKINIMIIISMILSMAIVAAPRAAYLESDDKGVQEYLPPPEIYIPPRPPRYIPPPPRYDDYYSFVRSLRLVSNRPIGYKGLEVYLIKSADYRILQRVVRNIITLNEAYRRGDIRISEHSGGVVSKIRIDSYSSGYIFIMSGEILSGGRQTRTIVRDVLVPPRARNIVVDVYCIEEGRWEDTKQNFAPAEPMLDSSIRNQVQRKEGQSSVWSGVREQESELSVSSETHDLLEVYKKRPEDSRLSSEITKMRRRLASNAIGMVAVKDGRIIGIEAFYSHSMFDRQFHKLFSSYYYSGVSHSYYRRTTSSDVKRFLRDLRRGRVTRDSGYVGAGSLYDVSVGGPSRGFQGSALSSTGEPLGFGGIVHLSLID